MTQSLNLPITQSLELAAVLFGPAFDHDFLVGVELYRVAALTVEIAEEAVLPSAEREVGHGRGDSDVNANVAGRRFIAETARRRSTRCEQGRLVAVGTAFEEGQRFVHVVSVNQAEHGTEDLGIREIAARGNIVENRWFHEIAGLVFRDLRVAAIQ